jgi:hypothetical protein
MKILYLTVMIAWGPFEATIDSLGIQIFNTKDTCLARIRDFSIKHDIKKEKCLPMFKSVYEKRIANTKFEFHVGKEWPIAGGHVCKKSRKGKLYSCRKLKDTTK